MRLYLVQHGEAKSELIDPKRPLTERGRQDVAKVAKFVASHGARVQTIWHSTKLRAKETAEIMAEAIKPTEGLIERKDLAPSDPVEGVGTELETIGTDLMIASHLPFLMRLSSQLLVGNDSHAIIGFRQGGVVCLEHTSGSWSVAWIVVPELF